MLAKPLMRRWTLHSAYLQTKCLSVVKQYLCDNRQRSVKRAQRITDVEEYTYILAAKVNRHRCAEKKVKYVRQRENYNISRVITELRSPAGPRRLGTATRISASLSRRLSAFFGSTPGQDPKGAKYAVLPSGHAGFPECAKRSEGRDSASIQSTPVSPCEPLCAIF